MQLPDPLLVRDGVLRLPINTKRYGSHGPSIWMQLRLNRGQQPAELQTSHLWWIEKQVCRLPYGFKPSQVGLIGRLTEPFSNCGWEACKSMSYGRQYPLRYVASQLVYPSRRLRRLMQVLSHRIETDLSAQRRVLPQSRPPPLCYGTSPPAPGPIPSPQESCRSIA